MVLAAPLGVIYMRVHLEFLQGAVFIGTDASGTFVPLGTGFLCGTQYRDSHFFFLVTANHVVDSVAGTHIAVRLNITAGGTAIMRMPKDKRHTHPDPANDLALFFIKELRAAGYDVKYTRLDRTHRDAIYANLHRPAVGEEVSTVGLYTSHFGLTKNVPVVRIGHIAMLPAEPVRTDAGYVRAYLVEVKSIAGLSGSPVFLQIPSIRWMEGQIQHLKEEMALLIGVMIGYHVVESKEDQIPVPQFQEPKPFREASAGFEERNTGFAVVIPEERLLEIIESDEMRKLMDGAI